MNDTLPNLVDGCHDLLGGKYFCLTKDGVQAQEPSISIASSAVFSDLAAPP